MKQKLILALFMLSLGIIGAQAQGAGLSYGEAVKAPKPTATKAKKTCPNCGITMGNITYPWQHEDWCPYYRSQGGGSSSSRSSSSSSSNYTAASAATTALGALLSGLISNNKSSQRTTSAYDQQKAKKEEDQKATRIWYRKKQYNEMIVDEQKWKAGDYVVKKGKMKDDAKEPAYGIYNNQTKKWLLDADSKNDSIYVFRSDYDNIYSEKYVPRFNRIQLLTPPEGYTTYPIAVWMTPSHREVGGYSGKTIYSHYDSKNLMFVIDKSSDKLVPLKDVSENKHFLLNVNGKVGLITKSYEVILPAEYDKIERLADYDLYKRFRKLVYPCYSAYKSDKKSVFDHKGAMLDASFNQFTYMHSLYNDIYDEVFIVGQDGKYGIMTRNGKKLLPIIYNSPEQVHAVKTENISYMRWYLQEASKYIDKKGEFEKTDHFEARMKDAKMQEEYLREVMADAPQRYLAEKVPNKENLKLTLGEYDADKECFPISLAIAPWNIFMLPVPIADAKEFKTEFESIKASATKTAQLGIRYDAPSVEAITFTANDGKVYKYGE